MMNNIYEVRGVVQFRQRVIPEIQTGIVRPHYQMFLSYMLHPYSPAYFIHFFYGSRITVKMCDNINIVIFSSLK